MFVGTNALFLKDDYVNNFKLKSIVILEEMLDARVGKSLELSSDDVVVLDIPHVMM